MLFGSGLFGDGRLRDLIGRYVTPDLLAAVAAEHAKGRRLLVVTANLDAQRAVIWNMGAIAASGAPNAVALFRGHGRRGDKVLDNPTCLRMRIEDGQVVEIREFVWNLYEVDEFWE